jgi:hypothetical protein
MISGFSHFGTKVARQIPSNPSGHAKNDYVNDKLGCNGIISNENSDAKVDYGNRQPEPDENPGTIYGPHIFALVDRVCDEEKNKEQNKTTQRNRQRMHFYPLANKDVAT